MAAIADQFERLAGGRGRSITDAGGALDKDLVEAHTVDVSALDTSDVSALGAAEIVKVCSKDLPLTRTMAAWVINMAAVPGERPLRPAHVGVLATAMQRGTFRSELVHIAACQCLATKTVYRANGQHTAWARESIEDEGYAPVVHLELYRVATMDGVRALYAQYDRGAPRTKGNLLESYLADLPPFNDYGRPLRGLLGLSLVMYLWPTSSERAKHDADSVVTQMVGAYRAPLEQAAVVLRGAPRGQVKHLWRTPVVAAMIGTVLKAPRVALEFWSSVRDGTALTDVNDPRLRLRNALMQTAIGAKKSRKNDDVVSSEVMHRECVAAWNAYREHRTLTSLRASSREERPAYV
jgi:hypothetical protein